MTKKNFSYLKNLLLWRILSSVIITVNYVLIGNRKVRVMLYRVVISQVWTIFYLRTSCYFQCSFASLAKRGSQVVPLAVTFILPFLKAASFSALKAIQTETILRNLRQPNCHIKFFSTFMIIILCLCSQSILNAAILRYYSNTKVNF